MGIPSYFSYIIKNYSNIIRSIQYHKENGTTFDSLYMDCNSIIYDIYNGIKTNNYENVSVLEIFLIEEVIRKIEFYIELIQPSNTLYITFDGVAPLAKMEQQRTRRYKSYYMNNKKDESQLWNTCSITPGTSFMNNLSKKISKHFSSKEKKYNIKKIIVSGSDYHGEGEHKIFEYIRNNQSNDNILVYGLDSDLIMLSLFHYELTNNIYVFREAPEFLKSKIYDSDKSGILFMDIKELSLSIMKEMSANDTFCVYDYIFLCFFLGNDFLPHFPSLNIRTNGIQILMETYRKFIGNYTNRFFISKETGKIQWNWVYLFISEIAKHEHNYLLKESIQRDKFDNYKWEQTTPEEKENLINNVPVIYRIEEKYIFPQEQGWEERYYRSLFHKERTTENVKNICENYLSGLEWVFKYYTEGCPHWRWKYHYNYPPLFVDLLKYIPKEEKDFIVNSENNVPFKPQVQLSYVIPIHNHDLLLKKHSKILDTKYKDYFTSNFDFQWAYCRYFWESHIILPEVPLHILESWEKELM
jgi:5'-3' exonuclease